MTIHTIVGKAWLGNSSVTPVRIRITKNRITTVEHGVFKDVGDGVLVLSEEQVLLPGFHDAHLHLLTGGLQMAQIDFTGAVTVDQVLARVSDYIARVKPAKGEWVQGYGLEQTEVTVTRLDFDRAAPDNPLFVWTHDLHSAIVNSQAFVLSRVDGSTKNPADGIFERGADGKLSGVLRENAAYHVRKHIPEPDAAQSRVAFKEAQAYALSLGITAASASVRSDLLPHYLSLADSMDQKVRLNIWKVTSDFDFEADRFEKQSSEKFRYACFKGFSDGALGSRTASMWQPYTDDSQTSGSLLVREGPLARFIRSAHREGYQIAMHAIGDRANSVVLDAIEMAGANGIGPELLPRIEHCQHLRERDIPRFAKMGVIASMQPIHCTADMNFVERRLGTEREKGSYVWRSLINSGAILAFGSDWPIETMDPIAGIHAAVTRTKPDGTPTGGWHPEECLTVEQSLRAYTEGAAYAAGWESSIGKIAEGMLADLCVLNGDPFIAEPLRLHTLKVDQTIVDGNLLFSRAGSQDPAGT